MGAGHEQAGATVHVGVGLWNMRSTARHPAALPVLYRSAVRDAVAAEAMGFDSFWFGEHRFWYDGWCPQPLLMAAAVAGATSRIRVGTAMHLLPQHSSSRTVKTVESINSLFPDRLELGVSIGYRAEEYDGMGLRMASRVSRLEGNLDALAEQSNHTRIWVGGMAEPAIKRAAGRGLSLMLPPTLGPRKVKQIVDTARATAAVHGTVVPRIGIMKDVWVDDDARSAQRYFLPRVRRHYREYVTAWWALDESGAVDRDKVESQVQRNMTTVLAGSPESVMEALLQFVETGIDTLVLQVHCEETAAEVPAQLRILGSHLLPELQRQPTCV